MEIKTEDSFHDIRNILGLADDTECCARWQSSLNIKVLWIKTFYFG